MYILINYDTEVFLLCSNNCSIGLGMASLLLPEHQTIKAASSLLVKFITLSPSSDIIAKVVAHKGKDLVQCLLKGIAGETVRSQLDYISNIFSTLLQYFVEDLSIWLKVRKHHIHRLYSND